MTTRNSRKGTYATLDNVAINCDSIPAIARQCGPVIYAMRTDEGTIKIGYTTRLANRASQLFGLGNLLALKPGTYADEQALHRSLKGSLAHGREWYYETPEVFAVINEMRARMGLSQIDT